MAKGNKEAEYNQPYSNRVKGGAGGQNDGSAKTMSGGNKRGDMKRGGGSSMGVKPRNNYPGGMGNS